MLCPLLAFVIPWDVTMVEQAALTSPVYNTKEQLSRLLLCTERSISCTTHLVEHLPIAEKQMKFMHATSRSPRVVDTKIMTQPHHTAER